MQFLFVIHELFIKEHLLPQGEISGLHAANIYFALTDIALYSYYFFWQPLRLVNKILLFIVLINLVRKETGGLYFVWWFFFWNCYWNDRIELKKPIKENYIKKRLQIILKQLLMHSTTKRKTINVLSARQPWVSFYLISQAFLFSANTRLSVIKLRHLLSNKRHKKLFYNFSGFPTLLINFIKLV